MMRACFFLLRVEKKSSLVRCTTELSVSDHGASGAGGGGGSTGFFMNSINFSFVLSLYVHFSSPLLQYKYTYIKTSLLNSRSIIIVR